MDIRNVLLELTGQDAESQIKNETTAFDVKDQKQKRSAGERFFDKFLGREGEIQEAAKSKHIKNMENTQAYRGLKILPGEKPVVDSFTTEEDLLGKLRTAKKKDAKKDRQDLVTEQYYSQPAVDERARIASREKESDRRYYEDRISDRETKLMELDLKKQGQRNEMAMFDKRLAADARSSKRERMMALMAGLANLGGAFAI